MQGEPSSHRPPPALPVDTPEKVAELLDWAETYKSHRLTDLRETDMLRLIAARLWMNDVHQNEFDNHQIQDDLLTVAEILDGAGVPLANRCSLCSGTGSLTFAASKKTSPVGTETQSLSELTSMPCPLCDTTGVDRQTLNMVAHLDPVSLMSPVAIIATLRLTGPASISPPASNPPDSTAAARSLERVRDRLREDGETSTWDLSDKMRVLALPLGAIPEDQRSALASMVLFSVADKLDRLDTYAMSAPGCVECVGSGLVRHSADEVQGCLSCAGTGVSTSFLTALGDRLAKLDPPDRNPVNVLAVLRSLTDTQ